MARSRNLKPGYFTNDVLGALPPLARILFAGLWTLSDREGRCEDRPRKIKAELLPYDECDADALLALLHDAGFIDRYEVDGIKVIQVVKWDKHQNPHVKEAPSTLPARCESGASPVQASDEEQPSPERAGLIPSSLIPSLLIPDSLNTAASVNSEADGRFDRFWQPWPRKEGKEAARKAFNRLKPDEVLLAAMLAAVAGQKLWPTWAKDGGQFIPHAATWLNGRRWEDEAPPGLSGRGGKHSGFDTRNHHKGVSDDGTLRV